MPFAIGVLLFALGSVFVGVCLAAIPGPEGSASPPHTSHGHDHGGH